MNEITVANYRDDETKVPNDRTDEAFLSAIVRLVQTDGETLGIASHVFLFTQGEYGHVQD